MVAGIRTPLEIAALQEEMPAIYEQLLAASKQLEEHYRDMQDIEFTVENNKLYLLQTRSGKGTLKLRLKLLLTWSMKAY